MEKHEFDISMETEDVFAFLAGRQFLGIKGLINLALNIIIILCLVLKWSDYELTPKLLLILVLFMLDIYSPIVLYSKAKAQAKGNDSNEKEYLHYQITEEGINVSGNDESLELLWGHVQKYKAGSKRIFVYTSTVSAFIFPKNQIGDSSYEFLLKQLKANKSDFGMKSLNTAKYTAPEEEGEDRE